MKTFSFEQHADSLLPEGKNWKLVWNDEFDGTELDTSKWNFRLNFWGKRFPAFTTDGVVLDGNSHLQLHVVKHGDQYCSPHLQTGTLIYDIPKEEEGFWPFAPYQKPTFMHRYGYYEIRCRLQRQPGWWSAFWIQSPCIGATDNPTESGVEVDIMENFTRDNIISHNNHWNGYGSDHQHAGSGDRLVTDTPDGFHLFGLEWTPDEYIYYVDGKESWRCNSPVSHREQFLLVSTECMGYRETPPAADPQLLAMKGPDYFEVDHVRVFDPVGC